MTMIKVHLVKSSEVSSEMFTQVVDLLQAIPGPIVFTCKKDSILNIDKEEKAIKTINEKKDFE